VADSTCSKFSADSPFNRLSGSGFTFATSCIKGKLLTTGNYITKNDDCKSNLEIQRNISQRTPENALQGQIQNNSIQFSKFIPERAEKKALVEKINQRF